MLRLFDVDLNQMVNSIVRINKDLQIDFSYIDKILLNFPVIQKEQFLEALQSYGFYQAYEFATKGSYQSQS